MAQETHNNDTIKVLKCPQNNKQTTEYQQFKILKPSQLLHLVINIINIHPKIGTSNEFPKGLHHLANTTVIPGNRGKL